MTVDLTAPFPWFGGKRRVADVVWRAFGNPPNYIEPFFGSGAVLLGRPGGAGKIETVNDIDGAIPNFWRAVKADPDRVAEHCDWPVSEVDLHARHQFIVLRLKELRPQLLADPEFYDAQLAGWWVWGICQWIGGGWGKTSGTTGKAFSPGRLPHLGSAGEGIHKTKLSAVGNNRGIFGVTAPPCRDWFRQLAVRLRGVRICCGDWDRVLGESTRGKGKNVGGRRPCAIFFDPPYPHERRDSGCYAHDGKEVWFQVRDWAVEHGDDQDLRIAVCGYAGDFGEHEGWAEYAWRGARGYSSTTNDNRELERIWFSRWCLPFEQQTELW